MATKFESLLNNYTYIYSDFPYFCIEVSEVVKCFKGKIVEIKRNFCLLVIYSFSNDVVLPKLKGFMEYIRFQILCCLWDSEISVNWNIHRYAILIYHPSWKHLNQGLWTDLSSMHSVIAEYEGEALNWIYNPYSWRGRS